jgi:Nuclease-related domain
MGVERRRRLVPGDPHMDPRVGSGRAGTSARAEYERRKARDEERGRRRFGRLAPLVRVLAGPKPSTEAWARGAEGEELVGRRIDVAVGTRGVVLHDRRLPGSRSNLDHLVIVASGVWVIDAKHYHGRLATRQVGGCFSPRRALTIGRRDQSRLIAAARRQQATVASAVGPGVAVRAALCFTGVERSPFARPFVMDGVVVTWPGPLASSLRASGPLSAADRERVAARLARAFPPYRP